MIGILSAAVPIASVIEMPFSPLSSAMSISNIRAFLIDSSPTVFISVQHVVICSLTDLTNSAKRTKLLELNCTSIPLHLWPSKIHMFALYCSPSLDDDSNKIRCPRESSTHVHLAVHPL